MIEAARELFAANPVFAGMVSAGALGAAVYQIRALPKTLWKLFSSQFVLTLRVHHDDKAYRDLSKWLSKHADGKKARRVQLTALYNPVDDKMETIVTPGPGWHRIREGKRTFFVHREVREPGPDAVMGQRTETMTLYTMGRDPSVYMDLAQTTAKIYDDPNALSIFTANTSGGFVAAGKRTKRPLDTIDIPVEMKKKITDKIDEFLASRESYAAKAIPWRLGILLEGVPGSGKSSLVVALGAYVDRSIYLINPSIMEKDSQVQDALNNAGAGLVALEDVDSIPALHKRRLDDNGVMEKLDKEKDGGLTLSGFLNAFDGVASHEGRILILTTNHADVLDPAVTRPGRIDLRINIGVMEAPEIVSMFTRLNPGQTITETEAQPWVGLPPAEVQNMLLDGQHPNPVNPH